MKAIFKLAISTSGRYRRDLAVGPASMKDRSPPYCRNSNRATANVELNFPHPPEEESMGDRLKDKVAFISGAGSSGPGWGSGKATAVLFACEGAKVLAADINLDAALETKRIIEAKSGVCEAVSGGVSRADDVAAMVDNCIAAFGRIDVLHNNVGIVEVGGPRPARRVGTGSTM